MKTFNFLGTIIFSGIILQSCDSAEGKYVDLNTGNSIELVKDEKTGLMVDKETGETVELYVNRSTKDTIDGRTGKVINGKIRRDGDRYVYTLENENNSSNNSNSGGSNGTSGAYEVKNGDYKKEVEKDGDIKIKDGDTKIKIDGETGERKVKRDN